MKKTFAFFAAALLSVGMFAETVVFTANSKTKEVTVTLPHTFSCSFMGENGELDVIIKELYAPLPYGGYCVDYVDPIATGNAAVTAGIVNTEDQFITISAAFSGQAIVTGKYYKYTEDPEIESMPASDEFDYALTISIKGASTALDNTAVDTKAVKRIVDGQLLIERDGKFFNAVGAEVR